MFSKLTSLAGLALVGCSAAPSTAAHDAGLVAVEASSDGAPPTADAFDDSPDSETGAAEGGAPADAAAPDAAPTCVGLGAPCTTSATCLCSLGAGCEWDNVECRDGRCQLMFACDEAGVCDGSAGPLLPLLDAGYSCCSQCELAYDLGGTMAAWLACNAQCGAGQCPVECLARDRP